MFLEDYINIIKLRTTMFENVRVYLIYTYNYIF